MKIVSASKKENGYEVIFEKDGKEYKLLTNITLSSQKGSADAVPQDFVDTLAKYDLFTRSITDEITIEGDEHLTIIPKLYEVLPDDKSMPIGEVRYYNEYYHAGTFWLDFSILGVYGDDKDFNINDVAYALVDYLKWPI